MLTRVSALFWALSVHRKLTFTLWRLHSKHNCLNWSKKHKSTHVIYVTRVNIYVSEHCSPSEHLVSSNDEFWMGQNCGHGTNRQNYTELLILVTSRFVSTGSAHSKLIIWIDQVLTRRTMFRHFHIRHNVIYSIIIHEGFYNEHDKKKLESDHGSANK